MKSTHINLVLAAEVASGRPGIKPTTVVGTARDYEGNWYNAFIAFEQEADGTLKQPLVPVVSEKTGATKFNFRRQ
jgi:hypothetical protein